MYYNWNDFNVIGNGKRLRFFRRFEANETRMDRKQRRFGCSINRNKELCCNINRNKGL